MSTPQGAASAPDEHAQAGAPAPAANAGAFQALAQYGAALMPGRTGRRPPSRPDAPLICTLCNVSLVRTAYASRTRLCLACMRAPSVAGGMRFCQRCHRLHPLADFSGTKHSCEAKLNAGSARRQRRRTSPVGGAAPAPQAVPRTVSERAPVDAESSRLLGIALLTELLQSGDR